MIAYIYLIIQWTDWINQVVVWYVCTLLTMLIYARKQIKYMLYITNNRQGDNKKNAYLSVVSESQRMMRAACHLHHFLVL